VLENIILGVETTKRGFLKMDEARKKVVELSERYHLNVNPDAVISDITVGMQQRAEILKMLYRENEILIFDEPTAMLTPQEIDELMKTMKGLVKEGKSVLFITHKLDEIKKVADRCTILRKGKYIGTVDAQATSKEAMAEMMVGRKIDFVVSKGESKPGDVVLKVSGLTLRSKHSKKNSLNNVSFEARRGEILCIAGIDGNGQSELVQTITGLSEASEGSIELCGKDITHARIRQRSEGGMSHIPEDRHKHGLVLDYSLA
jgi:simple sugar transport system ATP-binding protein